MAACNRLPATGSFNRTESSHARPCRERRKATNVIAVMSMMPAIAHHHVLTKPEMLRSILVGSGSLAFSEAKKVRNFGSTNVARMITVAMAITATTAG